MNPTPENTGSVVGYVDGFGQVKPNGQFRYGQSMWKKVLRGEREFLTAYDSFYQKGKAASMKYILKIASHFGELDDSRKQSLIEYFRRLSIRYYGRKIFVDWNRFIESRIVVDIGIDEIIQTKEAVNDMLVEGQLQRSCMEIRRIAVSNKDFDLFATTLLVETELDELRKESKEEKLNPKDYIGKYEALKKLLLKKIN